MNGHRRAPYVSKRVHRQRSVRCSYGDDVIMNDEYPVVKQLCDAYEKYGKGVCGVQAVSEEAIQRYCTLAVDHIEDNRYYVSI